MTGPGSGGLSSRARLNLSVRLAQAHNSGSVVYWTAEDWDTIYAIHCTRLDPEHVNVAVRPVGPGGFAYSPAWN